MFYKPIGNSALVVPFYKETPPDAVYPHNTERMVYDKDDHRYYLTEAGLSHYGIDFEPERVKWLIRKASDHIYSYITFMAQTNADLMHYRIAKSLFGRHKSAREGRRQVERVLALQAEFINDYGDGKNTPKIIVSPETGRIRDQAVDMSEGFWLQDEVLGWLNSTHLTDPNIVYSPFQVKWDEY
jgi:hypothetical protein